MSYTVLARKWRPTSFSEIVGQHHVSQTLKNAIKTDRIAHGYIFTGPRGVGKTSAARIFAKALNCKQKVDGEPCNTCPSCTEIANGSSMDVIEIDGASNNSVDNIRDLRDNIRFAPTAGDYKIYIIDEVHMLSKGAFNALLKTLEEPPKHAIFIFATTEIHKVLPTILSRCQRFDFRRIAIPDIINRLSFICQQENISIDQQALLQIAKKADGGMRDSQSLLDQMVSFCGNSISLADVNATLGLLDHDIYFQFVDAFSNHDSNTALNLIDQLFKDGHDLGEVVFGLEEHLRNVLIAIATNSTDLIDSTDDIKSRYQTQAQLFSEVDLLRMVDILQKTEFAVKTGQNPKIKLELAFSKLCQLDTSRSISDLISDEKKKSPEPVNRQSSTPNFSQSKPIEKPTSQPITNETEQKLANAPIEKPVLENPLKPESQSIPQHLQQNTLISPQQGDREKPIESRKQNQSFTDSHTQTVETAPPTPTPPAPITPAPIDPEPATTSNESVNQESDVHMIKDVWDRYIESFRKEKPSLYVNLFHSMPKSIKDNVLTIYFDTTSRGMVNVQTFERNIDFIQSAFHQFSGKSYTLKHEQISFEKLGFKKEFNDINTIVKNLRSEHENFDTMMNMLGLDVIDMEESNGF